MNYSSFCYEVESGALLIGRSSRIALAVGFVLVGVIGIIANSLVVYIICKNKHQAKQSIRLIMYLSLVDLYSSVALNAIYTVYLLVPGQLPCFVVKILYGFSRLAIYSTSFFAILTGIDRCLHIIYLENYLIAYSSSRFQFSLVGYFALVMVQTIITVFCNTQKGLGNAGRYTAPVNIVVVVLNIIMYVVSIKVLRSHKRQNKFLSRATKRITRIASVYFALFLAFQGILGLYQMVFIKYLKKELHRDFISIFSYVIYYLPTLSGICNAVVFLKISKLLHRRIGVFCKTNRVGFNDSGANIPRRPKQANTV